MISRRQFLRGNFSAAKASKPADGTGKAQIGPACMAYNNVVCRSCGDACAEQAIRFSPRVMGAALPVVLEERCTGCGDCIPACPADAIRLA